MSLNGRDLDPGQVFDGGRILLEDLAAENELVVRAVRVLPHRRGHAPLRRPRGRRGVPLHPVRAGQLAVFANFEQPDLKAPYRFEVRAPEGWTVWSNGVGELADGVWRFAETKPISTLSRV
ncbi:Aminopeptidase N OS=Streptomyces albaduncus OX=68172 GN=FHS32_000370 PE=3 SV=1 [Streptomyces griseoloalbus]